MKPRIREVIVVEGRYDKNTLLQAVDATVLTTGGFSVFHDRDKTALIRRLALERGVILLMDSDGAGFVIRHYLQGVLPPDQIKHAYIPDVSGKERRKRVGGREGKLGVEGMTQEVLLTALRRAGATFEGEKSAMRDRTPITKADLLERGLVGAGSTAARQALLAKLELPAHLTPNAMLEVLNLLMGREELDKLTQYGPTDGQD